MIKRSFYFLRHGQTDGNVHKVFHGRTDTDINETGHTQSNKAAEILKDVPIDRLILSPMKRVRQTAVPVNAFLQKPLSYDEGLVERNYGIFEGMTRPQVDEWMIANNYDDTPPHPAIRLYSPPEGEMYLDFTDRVINTINSNLDLYPDENILFVSHGGVFNAIHFALFKEMKVTSNAHPYQFELKDGIWSLNCLVTEYEQRQIANQTSSQPPKLQM